MALCSVVGDDYSSDSDDDYVPSRGDFDVRGGRYDDGGDVLHGALHGVSLLMAVAPAIPAVQSALAPHSFLFWILVGVCLLLSTGKYDKLWSC